MSSLVINFPDCAKVSTNSRTNSEAQITVDADHCGPAGPPPIFGAWEIAAFIIAAVVLVVGIGTVRWKAHEMKPERLKENRLARQQEIDGQVALAKAHRQCMTCGDKYEPELTS